LTDEVVVFDANKVSATRVFAGWSAATFVAPKKSVQLTVRTLNNGRTSPIMAIRHGAVSHVLKRRHMTLEHIGDALSGAEKEKHEKLGQSGPPAMIAGRAALVFNFSGVLLTRDEMYKVIREAVPETTPRRNRAASRSSRKAKA
jgi:hypothetical protein